MKIKTIKHRVFRIVADGLISSTDLAEGRFFPVLIINANDDPSVNELLTFHQTTPPGDVTVVWSKELSLFNNNKLILNVKFLKPMPISFGIEFNLVSQYALVDGIISSRGFMFQSGTKEDKVSQYTDARILMEVPDTGFDKQWELTLKKIIKGIYKKKGVLKKDLPRLIGAHISEMRKMWNMRR